MNLFHCYLKTEQNPTLEQLQWADNLHTEHNVLDQTEENLFS